MRRSSQFVAAFAALALVTVAGQASAGQARPRSAPPSGPPSAPPSSSSEQGDRGRTQASRREAPAPPPSSSTQRQSRDSGRNDSRSDARNDARTNNGGRDTRNDNVRGGNGNGNNNGYDTRNAPQRQAVPAPRDRYMDLNRNGRDDRYENRNDNRYDSRYDGRYDNRDYRDDRYAPSYRYSGPRIVIAPRQPMRFTRSWFSFRPQLRLSIGLTVGYPIAFPSWYDPYVVGVPGYSRPYMPYGGVSFDVEPRDAELWVDGEYIGRVSDYSSYDPPLTLVAGRHHVELRGRNYRSIEFDISVVAGQVIPYEGTLPYVR